MTPPIPANDPRAPKYWRYETGGRLANAVTAFLAGERLNTEQLALMAAYCAQWIDSPAWDANPHMDADGLMELAVLRAGAGAIRSETDLTAWLYAAARKGVSPL